MGSRRLTISNRKFLRKFTPGYSRPGDLLKKLHPTVPVQNTERQVHPDQQGQQPRTVTVTAPPPDLPQHEQAGQPDWHVPYQVPIPVPSEPPQMPQQAPNQQPEQPLLQLMYPATNFIYTSYTLHIHFLYTAYTLHLHFTYTSFTLHLHFIYTSIYF